MTPSLDLVVVCPDSLGVSGGIFSPCPNTASCTSDNSSVSLATEATSDVCNGCKTDSSFQYDFSGLKRCRRNAAFPNVQLGERRGKHFCGVMLFRADSRNLLTSGHPGPSIALARFAWPKNRCAINKRIGRMCSFAGSAPEKYCYQLFSVPCLDFVAHVSSFLDVVSGFFQGFNCRFLVHLHSPFVGFGCCFFLHLVLNVSPYRYIVNRDKQLFSTYFSAAGGSHTHNKALQFIRYRSN